MPRAVHVTIFSSLPDPPRSSGYRVFSLARYITLWSPRRCTGLKSLSNIVISWFFCEIN